MKRNVRIVILTSIIIAALIVVPVIAAGGNTLFLPLIMKPAEPTPTPTPLPPILPTLPPPSTMCTRDWDCPEFGTRTYMWQVLNACNYDMARDPWRLDGDGDGNPCELLPP